MITIRRFLFVAFACCTTYPCASLAAEEIKNPSPDGRFALRIFDEQKVELIEKASGRVMVDLGEAWHNPGQVSQILVWSPDSKRVAYGNRGYKEGEVSVYFGTAQVSSRSPYLRTYRLLISSSPRTAVPSKTMEAPRRR